MERMANRSDKMKIGEMLVGNQVISKTQLDNALKVQSQSGGHLGSVLLEMGCIKAEVLQELLGRQYNLPAANLYAMEIDSEVTKLLPIEKMKQYQVIPLAAGTKNVFLAMISPDDLNTIKEIEFIIGKSVQPVVTPSIQIKAALAIIENEGGALTKRLRGPQIEEYANRRQNLSGTTELKQLFRRLVEEKASDLLLTAGVPPSMKKDNEIIRISTTFLKPQDTISFARELMTESQREEFEQMKEIDFAYTYPDLGRFRINIFKQRKSTSIAIRHINEVIPGISELGLPLWVEEYALKTQGLILITGPTGHGKTTTLASLIDIINKKRQCNIITIEDPIEYHHKHKSSNVNQREVGVDTDSFHEGLRHIFRQAPDVIVIGEMRDPESFAIAIQAAETGHLVLSTLHSNNTTTSIERIIDVFPAAQQQQIRVQLAESFIMILNQRLVPRKDGNGVVLACEKLISSVRSKNLIREGKTHQIRTMLQQASEDFESIDIVLARLFKENVITLDTGLKFCDSPVQFRQFVSISGKP